MVYPNCIVQYINDVIIPVDYEINIEQNTPLPEDKIEEEYIDIRPMVYKEWQEGTVDAVTITENEDATCLSCDVTNFQ